jgi:hypothetical protein
MYTAGSNGLPVTAVSSLSGLSYNEPSNKGKERETDEDCDMTGKKEEENSKDQRHSAMTGPLTHLFHVHSFSAIPSKVRTLPVEKVLWHRQIRNQRVKHCK